MGVFICFSLISTWSLSSYFHWLWFSPSCLFNFTLLPFREQLQNQFADKFPRKSATKCQRLRMNLLPRSNVAKFLTLCVQMSQSPVQESVSRKQCRLQYRKDCKTAQDTRKQCSTVQDEQCYNVPELKCVSVPRTVTETVHEEECSTEY